MNNPRARAVKEVPIRRVNGLVEVETRDQVAVEEPLEIRVEGQSVAVVMRTPGEDRELAAGFLVTEGLLRDADDLLAIDYCPHCARGRRKARSSAAKLMDGNAIDVRLRQPERMDLKKLTRHVFTSSSCGICSKATLQAVQQAFPPLVDFCEVDPQVIIGLPDTLAQAQDTFKRTGGLHACALFDLAGRMLVLREDVGRHNALDKVIGWALLENRLPLREHVMLLSGRASFEMMQKALAGGVAVVAAVSAPSSLAVALAQESGQTLVGFLRDGRMNIYAGGERVRSFVRSRVRSGLSSTLTA